MKKYIFEDYRDKAGIGSEKMFDTEAEAIEYAGKQWEGLNQHDKDSYLKDTAGMFRVYEIELTEEQLEQYKDDELEITMDELWCRDVADMLGAK